MKKHPWILSCVLTASFVGVSARASEAGDDMPESAKKAMGRAAQEVEDAFREGRMKQVIHRALGALLNKTFDVLREQGHGDYADRMEDQWQDRFVGQMGVLDLGDHEPLNQWLADFYAGVEARISPKILRLFQIEDIKIFNFGIPVTVTPKGNKKTQEEWGSEEYKLHFVPVAAATTYWVSNIACSVAVPAPISLGCGIAALAPRYGMQYWVAPKLSDEVYVRANPAL